MSKITLYKNHGKSVGSWKGWTEGAVVFSSSVTKLGGKWVTSQYTAKAKNVGRSNETTPEEQAVLENISKSKRKIDKGYVKTKKEASAPATNALGLKKPMLATSLDKVKPESIEWDTAYVQPKLDGHRALFVDGVLYSRSGKVINLPHIVDAIGESGLDHLHLDGELYVHGKPLQDISRLVKKHTEDSLEVKYHIYDCIMDLPFIERMNCMTSEAVDCLRHKDIVAVDTVTAVNMEGVMQFHAMWREEGYEGTMLRFGNDGYGTDKRSRKLLKIKEFHDAEFKVIGYEEGKPYIRGDKTYRVPVWICETESGATFNVTAAGNMNEKSVEWEHRDEFVGNMLTVKFHYLSKDGIPQVPIALRWREDL